MGHGEGQGEGAIVIASAAPCHCGYKGHGLLIFCWSWRCNCLPTQDMTTTHQFKYQTTLIKELHDEKKGWHSRIKRAYRQHAGLSQRHKIQFLKWYSYFENQQKTNNP